jgi:hypothetical protein
MHNKENDEEGHDDNPANDDDDNGTNDTGLLANEESQQEDGENILAEILRTTFVFYVFSHLQCTRLLASQQMTEVLCWLPLLPTQSPLPLRRVVLLL